VEKLKGWLAKKDRRIAALTKELERKKESSTTEHGRRAEKTRDAVSTVSPSLPGGFGSPEYVIQALE